jgi:RsmE family RNA methyltransferase
VNILLLEEGESGSLIPRGDRRWEHVKKVLKKAPGESLAAGMVDGPLGEAIVRELGDSGLVLDFEAFDGPAGLAPALAPVRLVLGFPRPIQAARILKELTSLGLAEIHLTGTELGEKSYAMSAIFKDQAFRRPLIEGAEQAGNPRLPKVFRHWSLRLCLEALASRESSGEALGDRIFLHPYGDSEPMGAYLARSSSPGLRPPVTLAVGSERGWTETELAALRSEGFSGKSLGSRILKTETAALAASVLALAALDII